MSNNVPQDLMSLDEISNLLATHPVTMETLAKVLQGIVHQLAGSNRDISILDQGLRGPGNNISALTVNVTENATVKDLLTAGSINTDGSLQSGVVNTGQLRVASGQPTTPVLVVTDHVEVGAEEQRRDLTVHGHLVLDGQGNPVVYGGTGDQELNGHLDLLNTPELRSALGLKAGGILVSDAYSFATPGKNDLIVKGNVGIGTATPAQKLHVNGSLQVDGAVTGNTLSVGAITASSVQMGGNRLSQGSGNALRIQTPAGFVLVGPQNAGWSHFETDRPRYYFDKEIRVDSGLIGSYDEDLQLCVRGAPMATLSAADGALSVSGAGIRVKNPTDDRSIIELNWHENHPRLRVGGDGPHANSEFQIQGVGNAVRLRLDKDGNMWVIGDLHVAGRLFMNDREVRYHRATTETPPPHSFPSEPYVNVWGP